MNSDGSVSAEDFFRLADRFDRTADALAASNKALANTRTPSKAHLIGYGRSDTPDRTAGEFITGLTQARSRDASDQALGKATLEAMTRYVELDAKATLGTTDATGGWVIPNALVENIEKPALYANPYRGLVTVRRGVNSAAVDVPFRSAATSRAVIAPVGNTKENSDLAYNGYTATMYTLARIYDLSRQFVRTSAGAAEADVLEELGNALGLGERYYLISGSGSSEPYGLLTALTGSPAVFTSSFTPSATTLAGSVLKAIATCVGALGTRNRSSGLTAVMSTTSYTEMISQGTDTAGFFFNGLDMAALPGVGLGTLITPFGVPVIPDSQFPEDRLVVGQFNALKLFIGEDARIDSSDQAGTRWDTNLIGFRGEEDMAFDARPAVYAGAFQQVTNLIA